MHAIATFNPSTLTRCPRPTVTIDPFGITAAYLDDHETAIDRVLADRALAPELRKAAARLIANMLAAAGRIALDRQLGARATAISGRLAATADAIPGDENVGNELLLAALRAASVRQTGGAP